MDNIDRQKTLPRFRSVRFFIAVLFSKQFHLNLESCVWRRHVGALPRGTNMAAGSKQKHLSLSFATEMESFYSESSRH